MPDGLTTWGFAYFVSVKLAGYTVAGCMLNSLYRRSRGPIVFGVDSVAGKPVAYASPLLFGVARTVLGILGGFVVCVLGTVIFGNDHLSYDILAPIHYPEILVPIRYVEWLLVVWWFYGRASSGIWRLTGYALLGGIWSCLLDIPAVLPAVWRTC